MDDDSRGFFFPILDSGPWNFLIAVLLVVISIYHLVLSIRTLSGRGGSSATGIHLLLLLAGPCLLFLLICATLPTTFPDLFVVGIDADEPVKATLRFISFLGYFCLGNFILNGFLVFLIFKRSARVAIPATGN